MTILVMVHNNKYSYSKRPMNLLTFVDNENNAGWWSIRIPNGEFQNGFVFGAYYGLAKLGKAYDYRFSPSPYDKDWTINDTAMAFVNATTYQKLMQTYNQLPTEIKKWNTVIIVRSPLNTQLMYMLYIAGSVASYLQGMFTALQAFNVPITEVLLTQPLLNGTYFNIQGLELPQTL